MKIPDSIRIGGIEYAIQYDPKPIFDNTLCYGVIDPQQSLIIINSEMGYEMQSVTVWHEILHALFEQRGIESEDEEHIVDQLSRGIYQVLQDNARRLYDLMPVEETHENSNT